MGIHDHCRSCYSRHCDFDVVDDVSCELVSCPSDCGQKLHKCKSEDHAEVCLNRQIHCINKEYGCPVELRHSKLAQHLEVCPASVVMCTMQWSRWNRGSLIAKENDRSKVGWLKGKCTIDYNLDIACAVHDQRILLETIMPRDVLKYYSDLADEQTTELNNPEIVYDEHWSSARQSTAAVTATSKLKSPIEEAIASDSKNIVESESHHSPWKSPENSERHDHVVPPAQTVIGDASQTSGNSTITGPASIQPVIDDCNNEGQGQQTSLMQDSSASGDVAPYEVSHQQNAVKSRKSRLSNKLKNRSWLFDYTTVGSSANIASLGWMPRKICRDASTDTSDLPIDMSTMEWLSPETSISKDDLLSRLFSMLGSISKRGSAASEKQTSHYTVESAAQTVVPFLLNVDLNSLGRQLCSYTVCSSSGEERKKMRFLLTTHQSEDKSDSEYFNISENLAYHSLGISTVVDSLSGYRVKPHSMYTFMCGCSFRRDQYASHVQNVHCEVISWLNGWIEHKCPYSSYGCTYSSHRFCPNSTSNAIIYKPNLGCFAVSHNHWSKKVLNPHHIEQDCPLLNIPYEMHEMLLAYLDSFSLSQIALTCKYFRELCKRYLVRRGIVEVQWIKRDDEMRFPKWEFGDKIWHFPIAFDKVDKWVPSEEPSMAQHVAQCKVKADQDRGILDEPLKLLCKQLCG